MIDSIPQARQRFDSRRFARLAAFAMLSIPCVLLALMGVAAWLYAWVVLHPGCQGDRASLEVAGFPAEAVEFTSRDGSVRRGWYSPGAEHPEIAIIVLPGHAGNSAWAVADAAMLARAGYSTLIYEHRTCADPSLTASTGYYEAQDMLGAVEYLASRPDIEHIGAMGESEGGTAIVLAAADEPRIEAVVAMGGYTSLADDVLDPGATLSAPERLFRQLVVWAMSTQLGVPAQQSSPINVVGRISPRPILLIYGEYEAPVGEAMLAAAHPPVELWIVPGSHHADYRYVASEEYQQRIVRFFDAAFGIERPVAEPN